jgi:NTP pyrophosphatase (non-canonical NTP hydrolase)
MKVFVVTAESPMLGLGILEVCRVHWTLRHAERNADNLRQTHDNVVVHETEIDPLAWLVNAYFAFRGLTEPNADDALHFLASETGEVSDAFVEQKNKWVRNNPAAKTGKRVDFETGDVIMMATKFAEKMGFDPLTAMVEKFQSKGWRNE